MPPNEIGVLFAVESPSSALFGALFRGEMLTAQGLAGCALILAGMVITALGGPPKEP